MAMLVGSIWYKVKILGWNVAVIVNINLRKHILCVENIYVLVYHCVVGNIWAWNVFASVKMFYQQAKVVIVVIINLRKL